MLSSTSFDIQTREELTLTRMIEELILRLSNPQAVLGADRFIIAKETRETLEWMNFLSVPEEIRTDLPRRAAAVDKFYAFLSDILRRELTRTLGAYQVMNELEELILSGTNTHNEIRNQATELIAKMLNQVKQKSVLGSNIDELTLREAAHIESGNYYHTPYSGAATVPMETFNQVESEITVKPSRILYLDNIYDSFTEETSDVLVSEGDALWDIDMDPLDVTYSIQADTPFNFIDLKMNMPFEVKDIRADISGTGSIQSIFSAVVGKYVNVKGESFLLPDSASIVNSDGTGLYSFLLPQAFSTVEITLTLTDMDLTPVELGRVIGRSGNIIDQFTLKETLLSRGAISGKGEEKLLLDLDERRLRGTAEYVTEQKSIRMVQVLQAGTYIGVPSGDGDLVFRSTTSLSKIESVEIYVDSYDPEEVISYQVDNGAAEDTISPVNSSASAATKVIYEEEAPPAVNIKAVIPNNANYLPIIRGIIVRTKEVTL